MNQPDEILINSDFIKLDQFLKWATVVNSGIEAKFLIEAGKVLVNEEIEQRRGRKLFPGDRVQVSNQVFLLTQAK